MNGNVKKSVKIVNNLPAFTKRMHNVMDDSIAESARTVLIRGKNWAPFKKGALRREAEVKQISLMRWMVSFWVEYARFQEMGGTPSHRVRRYSTAGTGAHFLERAGDAELPKLVATIQKHQSRIRV